HRITYWNAGAERLYGHAREEVLGRPVADVTRPRFIGPDDERAAAEALAAQGAWRGETIHLTKAGAERHVESSVSVVRDDAGRPAGLVAVVRDVTARARAETALRESEARKSAVLESALDCVVIMDHEGRILEFNPAAEKTFGYTRAEAIGRPMVELLVPAALRDRHRDALARHLATGQGTVLGRRIELTGMRADGGEFPVEVAITRVDVDGPPVFTGYIRDITDRRRAEAELHRRQQEATALARLARILTESRDVATVGERIVESVLSLYGLHMAAVRLLQPDGVLIGVAWGGAGRDLYPPGHLVPPGIGIIGRAVAEGRAVCSRDILEDPTVRLNDDMRARAARMGIRAVLAVPLRVERRIIGVLSVADRVAREFTAADADMIQAFADEAALALQSARLHEETTRRRREAEVIADLAASINASLDPDTVFQRVADGARELCRSDIAAIALTDRRSRSNECRYWTGVRPPRETLRVEPGKGAGGRVLLSGRPLRTHEYLTDPQISGDYAERVRAEGVVSLLVVPILIGGAPQGLVYVANRAPRPFTDDDEAVLVRLADHAAIAIQNARLFEEQVRLIAETERHHQEALALELVARQITSSLDREEVLQRIVDRARALCGSDVAALAAADETGETAHNVATSGARSAALLTLTIRRGRGVTGRVLETGEPFATVDYLHDPSVPEDHADAAREEGIVALAAVPIRLRGTVTGMLAAMNRSARGFSSRDLGILSKLADQAAIALENSRLYAERVQAEVEVRGRARQQAAIAELGQLALTGAAPPTLMDEAIGVVVQTLDVEYGAVFERLPDQAALVLRAGRGWAAGTVGRANVPGSAAGVQAALLREHGVTSGLTVPIPGGEDVFGVLAAYSTHPRAFGGDDRAFLQSVANVLATAIERRRAEERLRESERRLLEAQQVGQIGSWEWDIAADAVRWSDQLYGIFGLSPHEFRASYQGFLERVHPEDRPLVHSVIERALADHEPFAFECRIVRSDGAVGVIHARGKIAADPDGRAVRMVGIAQDVTDRRRADDALRQRAERLRIIHEIDQAIVSARSPEAIAHAALRRIRPLIPCKRASVTFFDFEARDVVVLAVDAATESTLPAGARFPLALLGDIEDLRDGRVRVTEDTRTVSSPALAAMFEAEGLRSDLAVPLLSRQALIGCFNLGAEVPGAFAADQVEIAREVAVSLAVAMQDARLLDQVLSGRERLQALSRRLVEVQEEERRHIARELHDEIGQVLTGLKLNLEMDARTAGQSPAAMAEARSLVNDLIGRVRDLSLDLRPAMLDDLGLLPALLWHFERYRSRTGVHVRFEHQGLGRRLVPEVETAAYRIVQEALTNTARHAGVGDVTVRVWSDAETLRVQVEDRGLGFGPGHLTSGDSSGLTGMRERAVLLGGQLTIESAPGAGTRVTATIPLAAGLERRATER
ncbi:MAG: GAF domain-containing protein, partial [Candidatus Rokuibacteriota bacterium]